MPENLYAFRYLGGRLEPSDMTDYADGLDALIEKRHYRQLPGLFPPIAVYESQEAGDRYLVKVTHGQALYSFTMADTVALKSLMNELLQNYSILPQWLFPGTKQTDLAVMALNYTQYSPLFGRRRNW